jgi:phosphatidylglycerophosphate synthase
MGRYHGRDLVRVPGLLSLARLPLAVAFPFALGQPRVAFAILVAAGLTDVLDGWYARRFGQVTAAGAVLDPITDKLFVLTVAFTLVRTGHLSLGAVVLLSTREIGELPLVVWLALSRDARRARVKHPSVNVAGKLATTLQFVAVSAALFHARFGDLLVGATSIVGAAAAFTYWRRALHTYDLVTKGRPDDPTAVTTPPR